MTTVRRLLLVHPALAALVMALALAIRVLVPAGYMPAPAEAASLYIICPGHSAVAATMSHEHHAMAMHAEHRHGSSTDPHERSDAPCAYGGLAVADLARVDPLMLVAAIAVVMTLAIGAPLRLPHPAARRLRPPPIGPPLD